MTAQAPTQKGSRTLRTPSYLEGTDIDVFVPVYGACAAKGLPGPMVDTMEVWQVAAALEIDMGDDSNPSGAGSDGPPPPGALSRGRGARIAEVSS